MKKLSVILIITGFIAGATVYFLSYSAAQQYLGAMVRLTEGGNHLKAAGYTVFTNMPHPEDTGFTLKDHTGKAYTFTRPHRQQHIFATQRITTNGSEYFSFGQLEIKKTGVYTMAPIGKKVTFYLHDKQAGEKWAANAVTYSTLWFLSIFIFGIGLVLRFVVFITKQKVNPQSHTS